MLKSVEGRNSNRGRPVFPVVREIARAEQVEGSHVEGDSSKVPAAAGAERRRPLQRVAAKATASSTEISLGYALTALARSTDRSSSVHGSGDAQYWMRVTHDIGRFGLALGGALDRLAATLPKESQALVESVAVPLKKIRISGPGDSAYWLARSNGVGGTVRRAGDQLAALAKLQDAVPQEKLTRVISELLTYGFDAGGRGHAQYWAKAAAVTSDIANDIGDALYHLANASPSPRNTLLKTYARQLQALGAGGTGNAAYWMERTSQIVGAARDVGRALAQLDNN